MQLLHNLFHYGEGDVSHHPIVLLFDLISNLKNVVLLCKFPKSDAFPVEEIVMKSIFEFDAGSWCSSTNQCSSGT